MEEILELIHNEFINSEEYYVFLRRLEEEQEELKVLINDYNKLKVNLTATIGRIRSTYI